MLERADGMGTGDTLAINSLLETLLISGFSMAVAGTSAPASGAEHLISHYWDMEQHCHHEPVLALHGTQVGIGTLVSAFTLNRLLELPQERLTEAANLERNWSAEQLKPLHPKLTPPILSEMAIQLNKKTLDAASLRREIETLAAQWPEIKEQLSAIVLPEEMMKKALRAAGCPRRASELGVSRAEFVRTITHCRHIRSRFVNFDLAANLGLLGGWAEQAAAWIEGD
jgi:glycerol-1-phosphate dehydrogenase [NAD(P)+]